MSMQSTAAGSLGPRLAGRLTAELVLRCSQYMSCLGLYHIDMRGHRIGAIENLGATRNQFDCIDLSDNNIIRLEGFAKLERLRVLILCNNRIASVAPGLEKHLPKLDTLVLTNNKLEALSIDMQDLDPLAGLSGLTHLSLLENPIAQNIDFRLYAVFRLKHLKVLNFRKVSQAERDAARAKYGSLSAEEVTAQTKARPRVAAAPAAAPVAAAANGATPAAAPVAVMEAGEMTAEQQMAVRVAIANAATLQEVRRLEEALRAGQMPAGLDSEPAAMEED